MMTALPCLCLLVLCRAEREREKRDKIALGLMPPPPPKMNLSNFMKVLANEVRYHSRRHAVVQIRV